MRKHLPSLWGSVFRFLLLIIVTVLPLSLLYAQNDPLPNVVITQFPPSNIDMERSDFSLSGYISDPFTIEVQVQNAAGTPVDDQLYGPNTHFVVDVTLVDPRGNPVSGVVDSRMTENGIARFESIVLRVVPDVYQMTFTVRIVFTVPGLGSTSLTLDSVTTGKLLIGVQPTPIPSATPTINPYAGTPPVILTQLAIFEGLATSFAQTPVPTTYCPPTDLFGCNYPTSTPTATFTPTPLPVISPDDGTFTVPVDSRGASFQDEVSGPAGDTTDIIDLVFNILESPLTTNYSLNLSCPQNTNLVLTILTTGGVLSCNRTIPLTIDPLQNTVRVVVSSLSTREQIRSPYTLTISASR